MYPNALTIKKAILAAGFVETRPDTFSFDSSFSYVLKMTETTTWDGKDSMWLTFVVAGETVRHIFYHNDRTVTPEDLIKECQEVLASVKAARLEALKKAYAAYDEVVAITAPG